MSWFWRMTNPTFAFRRMAKNSTRPSSKAKSPQEQTVSKISGMRTPPCLTSAEGTLTHLRLQTFRNRPCHYRDRASPFFPEGELQMWNLPGSHLRPIEAGLRSLILYPVSEAVSRKKSPHSVLYLDCNDKFLLQFLVS